ncbi:MAG: carbohydrate ABC transporter permease [Lachnospiraceae bacterium]|nr:carbohydrate ABC transporter permease [Lachnospiraceae bacterium]
MKNTRKSLKKTILSHVGLIILSFIMIFPLAWWFFASFKTIGELKLPGLFPKHWTFENYIEGWTLTKGLTFGRLFLNNLFICFVNLLGAVVTSSLVAYGFVRLKFKFHNFWFSIVLLTLMLPSQVTVISQYIMYNKLGLLDTYVPLNLPYLCGGGAFFIFLMIQFMRGIPIELDESAKISGASNFQIYRFIVLPLLKAPLTTVAIYAFTWSWDDFYSQLLYLSTPAKFTVGLGLRMLIDAWDIQWGKLLAMSLLSIIPALILFFTRQKDFVEGISTTGLKG